MDFNKNIFCNTIFNIENDDWKKNKQSINEFLFYLRNDLIQLRVAIKKNINQLFNQKKTTAVFDNKNLFGNTYYLKTKLISEFKNKYCMEEISDSSSESDDDDFEWIS